MNGGQESYLAVAREEPFVAVMTHAELRGYVVDEFEEPGAGYEPASVVRVSVRHPHAKRGALAHPLWSRCAIAQAR